MDADAYELNPSALYYLFKSDSCASTEFTLSFYGVITEGPGKVS